jgi:hypothetical protein
MRSWQGSLAEAKRLPAKPGSAIPATALDFFRTERRLNIEGGGSSFVRLVVPWSVGYSVGADTRQSSRRMQKTKKERWGDGNPSA